MTIADDVSPPTQGDSSSVSKPPVRLSRRALLQRLAAYAVVPVVGGTYASAVEPFWTEFHELPAKIRHLPRAFEGFRLAQLTDLHIGETPIAYVRQVCQRVRELRPDAVVVTGDLTHHAPPWVEPTCRMLAEELTGLPVIVTFGNHEYGIHRGDDSEFAELSGLMDATLRRFHLTVLRNQSTFLQRGSDRLYFAGLDDFWFGNWDPVASFAGIPSAAATIALSHNPDTAEVVDAHDPSLILSGHTHGGQVRIPGLGALYLNTIQRQYDQGAFELPHSMLYVSRGVGYIHPLRFCCRPEVPIFQLQKA